jgi:hypothetical protein
LGLVEARLGGEVALGQPGLPLQVLLGVGQGRLGLRELSLDSRDFLRTLAEAQVGQLRSCAVEFRFGLADRRPLAPGFENEQERARLDLVAALHRHAFQPARCWRPEPQILALRVALEPAVIGPIAAGGEKKTTERSDEAHHAASPRSKTSICASSTRAGSNGSVSCGANRVRQIARRSTGATTSRATASLSCGRNSPDATPCRWMRAISPRPRSTTADL